MKRNIKMKRNTKRNIKLSKKRGPKKNRKGPKGSKGTKISKRSQKIPKKFLNKFGMFNLFNKADKDLDKYENEVIDNPTTVPNYKEIITSERLCAFCYKLYDNTLTCSKCRKSYCFNCSKIFNTNKIKNKTNFICPNPCNGALKPSHNYIAINTVVEYVY